MIGRLVWIGLLLPTSIVLGQTFSTDGRIVDAHNGNPIARATVSLEPVEGAQPGSPAADITTGLDGSFHFTGLHAGKYRLRAARRGYLTGNFDQHGDFFAAVVVGAGKPPATGIRFTMLPYATITGRVLDSSGDPVQSANVSLFMHGLDGTGAVHMMRTTFLREGDPTYEFDSLAPGTYYVAVSARPWIAEGAGQSEGNGPLDVAYPITFFENGDSSAAAEPIQLHYGDTAQVNVTLGAVHAVHVQIPLQGGNSVNTALNKPAFDSLLSTYPGVSFLDRISGGGGTADIAVAPGVYELGSRPGTAVDLTQSKTLPALSQPAAPVELTGKLAMADGSALPTGLRLRMIPSEEAGSTRIGFSGRQGRFGGRPQQAVETAPASDGSFHTVVSGGEYQLDLGADLKVTGVAASGASVTKGHAVQVGMDPVVLAATVTRFKSTVSGRVINSQGTPEAGVMIVLIPENRNMENFYGQDESDSDGTWSINGLAAGEYKAVAIRDGWDLSWKQPEIMSRYLNAAAITVKVPDNGTVTLPRDLPAQNR